MASIPQGKTIIPMDRAMDQTMSRIHLDRIRATFNIVTGNLQVIVVRSLKEGILNLVLLQNSPRTLPQASSGNMATNLVQGQKLSLQEVANIGGTVSSGASSSGDNSGDSGVKRLMLVGSGPQIQYWALYNGQWTKGPSAIYYNQQINTIYYNDQGQYLWSYEKYPNGYVDWQYLGYMYQGYYNMWFFGDARGYHQTAIWGSNSGWSNVLWIYVW